MLTNDEIERAAKAGTGLTLLHVLPSEIFEAKRIPGSKNACVYETVFLSRVAEILPDKGAPLIVYGAGDGSHDAAVAQQKLRAAGYTDVGILAGGLAAWENEGRPLEGTGILPAHPDFDGTFAIVPSASFVRWTGRNLFNHHSGTVAVRAGSISLENNALVAADFTIDLTTIVCEDIPDPAMNRMLVAHLESDDFFDVPQHPLATFVATSVEAVPEASEGMPNFLITGRFTLRGVTRDLTFPILVAAAGPDTLTGQAVLDLDRTDFGSIYGSGRFFRFLGKHVVNDVVHLHVKITAKRAAC